jgi:hypothetical protein
MKAEEPIIYEPKNTQDLTTFLENNKEKISRNPDNHYQEKVF